MMASLPDRQIRASRPASRTARFARAGRLGVPGHILPLVTLIYTCLVFAPEAAVNLGGANLTAYRAAILVLLIPVAKAMLQGRVRLLMPDLLVIAGSVWMIIAFLNLFSPGEGLIRASGIVLDALGAYLVARVSLQNYDDVRRVFILLAPGFFMAGAILAYESISQQLIYRPAFASIFGSGSVYVDGNAAGAITYQINARLGLMRAYSTFSHPILAGVTLASLLPIYSLSGIRSWPRWLGIAAAFLGFFSVSSVVMLMLAICAGMLLVDRCKPYIRYLNWPSICVAGIGALTLIHVVSESGVQYVLIRYIFDPHNGYVRIIQWEAAWQALNSSPWFGIGFRRVPALPDWLPSSIDAHLLAVALRSGWITSLSFYLAALWVITGLGIAIRRSPPRERNLIVGLNITLFLLLLASLTVTLFGETNVYFMAMIGVGAALFQLPRQRAAVPLMAMPNPLTAPLLLPPSSPGHSAPDQIAPRSA